MKLSPIISDIEEKGFEISKCTVESGTDCTISFRKSEQNPTAHVATIIRSTVSKSDLFSKVREWCNLGKADKHLNAGDKILIPALHIPKTNCEDEDFEEIDLQDVIVTAVHVEPNRVVFNFDDILFRHDIDSKCSGKSFDKTPLGIYLAKHFADRLKEYTGNVKVSLLSRENVFDENSKNFMPYFKPIKNRIKVLANENDTWWWWLGTPSASSSSRFCSVYISGFSYYGYAGNSDGGVAPAFEITAESK